MITDIMEITPLGSPETHKMETSPWELWEHEIRENFLPVEIFKLNDMLLPWWRR